VKVIPNPMLAKASPMSRSRSEAVYKPGERGWLKVKNRAYWKYELEREAATVGGAVRRRIRLDALARRTRNPPGVVL
jgi:hypothetical protein